MRSPIQIRNTLKVPVEIKLEINDSQLQNSSPQRMVKKNLQSSNFKLYLNPDSSTIIPMKYTKFDQFRLRPLTLDSRPIKTDEFMDIDGTEEPQFDWSNPACFDLQTSSEKQLFELKPLTLE